jgi:hypothetical protein
MTTEREDGWVEWSGGPNPVPGAEVSLRFRSDRGDYDAGKADQWEWRHFDSAGDIIAYRLTPSSDGGCGSLQRQGASVPSEQAETPVVEDHPSVGIGDISNYYGGLQLKREGGVDYWAIEDYRDTDWSEVPAHVAAALRTLITPPEAKS